MDYRLNMLTKIVVYLFLKHNEEDEMVTVSQVEIDEIGEEIYKYSFEPEIIPGFGMRFRLTKETE